MWSSPSLVLNGNRLYHDKRRNSDCTASTVGDVFPAGKGNGLPRPGNPGSCEDSRASSAAACTLGSAGDLKADLFSLNSGRGDNTSNTDQERRTTCMTARGSFEGKSVTPQVPNHLHNPSIEVLADSSPLWDGIH